MLILVPFILIIFVIYAVDSLYFDDVKPKNEPEQKVIEKKDNRKNYVNRYLKEK